MARSQGKRIARRRQVLRELMRSSFSENQPASRASTTKFPAPQRSRSRPELRNAAGWGDRTVEVGGQILRAALPVWRAGRESCLGAQKRSKTDMPMCWTTSAADNPRTAAQADGDWRRRGRPVDPAPCTGKPRKDSRDPQVDPARKLSPGVPDLAAKRCGY